MVRGIAYGFGWVMGATILVYILTLFLSQIEFIFSTFKRKSIYLFKSLLYDLTVLSDNLKSNFKNKLNLLT